MFSAIKNWAGGNKKSLVERYTDELSQITAQIHELDRKLERSQLYMDNVQSHLTYYGAAVTMCTFAYIYWRFDSNWIYLCFSVVLSFGLVCLCKWFAYKIDGLIRRKQSKQLAKLRATHQEKLEKLKVETNYHATSSIIQRFSGGEDQTEDTLTLMDEELKGKYEELKGLKEELAHLKQEDTLKNEKERDKWFDRVINVVAGGDDFNKMIVPVVCGNCKKQTGSYRLLNRPLQYVCPLCGWSTNENSIVTTERKEPKKAVEASEESRQKD